MPTLDLIGKNKATTLDIEFLGTIKGKYEQNYDY